MAQEVPPWTTPLSTICQAERLKQVRRPPPLSVASQGIRRGADGCDILTAVAPQCPGKAGDPWLMMIDAIMMMVGLSC